MRPIRLGMVGGGEGAFIGGVHRMASRLDGRFSLVAGALSSDADRAARSALAIGISADRSYSNFHEMAAAEAARADGIEAVSIVTPNHLHGEIATAFLTAGIHVICDKPLTATLAQAEALAKVAEGADAKFFLTHNYTGYPMVRQARQMVEDGLLGRLRIIQAEYLQDWLSDTPDPDNKQAAWRTDPIQAGGGAIGDIGTHAYNLACFVTGELPTALCATLSTFVPGRQVDDDARVQMRYASGAQGHLWASQVATGNENALTLRLYGELAGLSWSQEAPNSLTYTPFGQPSQIITRGGAGAGMAAEAVTRIPAGHPEGYLDAFATLYREAADAIEGHPPSTLIGLDQGMAGVRFISTCQASSAAGGAWREL
ncbi:Gfo/Idh/MocA family protein [Pontivivens insulae]|uniref:Glucose--fructose oxidoreductase n=1 Tax=Pontivivens insulae TaxID=1639689 RepID=A0A2R8A8Z7_9RHOB|nr:Gfo/Idh/MocA family oxidoreductase [Pontivivens insulae]RED18803.1 putative dehydrogenase [Pontivivens insulae]SPF28701.1 Glucose--fructose oxidoreductase [Pontivivens insulae]